MTESSQHNGSATASVDQSPQLTADLRQPPKTARSPRPLTKTLYFAYGSDMQISYMAGICPSSRYIGRATLTDYRWQINSLGFANIIGIREAHAPGLVFELDGNERGLLEKERFPLYKNIFLDAELIPAPNCLYRRQTSWIADQGGPEAVLEREQANGRAVESRASYGEKKILAFVSTQVTDKGRPNPRYAEAINAAASDAMALGISADFFESQVEKFMPGRLLPILRVVRRPSAGIPRAILDKKPGHNSPLNFSAGEEDRPDRGSFQEKDDKGIPNPFSIVIPEPVTDSDGGKGNPIENVELVTSIYKETGADLSKYGSFCTPECREANIVATHADLILATDAEAGLHEGSGNADEDLFVQHMDRQVQKSTAECICTPPSVDTAISVSTISTASAASEVPTAVIGVHINEQRLTSSTKRPASINGRRPMSRFDRFLIRAFAEPQLWIGQWPTIKSRSELVLSLTCSRNRRRKSF